ncbi:AAEL013027-PA [Aedes aegypti]|nr:AAEL013027-PA [Aedes aegypti]
MQQYCIIKRTQPSTSNHQSPATCPTVYYSPTEEFPSNSVTMNKFIILAIFALAVGAMADYPKPAYHAPPPPPPHHLHAHPAPAPVVHTYPVHAPHAKCGANLLVGCAPSVAHVPCVPLPGHAPAHGYGHAPAPHYRAPESDSFDQFEE